MLRVAASAWEVIPALASVVVAVAALIAAVQVSRLQQVRAELERRALEARLAERSIEHARLETQRLMAELLTERLTAEALVAPSPRGSGRSGARMLSRADLESRERKLAFLARKRIDSVAAADAATETLPSDLRFAAGAAELFGQAITSREGGA